MPQPINILFLGGAKRVSMARLFKKAADSLGHVANIFSYETDTHVPIASEGKVIVGLRWKDTDIYDDLYKTVIGNDISIIVPFVDEAVAVAAGFSAKNPGTVFVPAADEASAEKMFDKIKAEKAFSNAGLPIPATYHAGDPCLRLIAKPRLGSASKGIINITTPGQLDAVLSEKDAYLIQERIDNREEYTVDCYVSTISGDPIAIVPRLRIEVTGGEVTRTATFHDIDVINLARKALDSLGLRGAVTIQMLRDLDDNRLMIMEINPRLGGGAVCSVIAGADIPAMIIEESLGRIPDRCDFWHPGTEMTRYMQEVVFFN